MSILWRLALLSVAASGIVNGADAQTTCAVPAKTLSFDCGAACVAFEPCMRMTTVTPSFPSSCDLECLRIDKASPSSYNVFSFLIPFDDAVGDTLSMAHKSNDALAKIAKLTLPSTTTDVIILGGSSLTEFEKGSVAKVEIAADFLAPNSQLTLLKLSNLDLASTIGNLALNLPPKLQNVVLDNDMLKAFPAELVNLKSLASLSISTNRITQVDQSLAIPQLKSLELYDNNISKFTALYPKLTYLDLANNKLTEVPAVVKQYTKLTTLYISGNDLGEFKQEFALDTIRVLDLDDNFFTEIPPAVFKLYTLDSLYLEENKLLKNLTLTNEQANFIDTLKEFTVDAGTFSTACDLSQQVTVQGFTVCITGGKVDLSIINAPRPPAPTPAPTSSSPPASSSSGSAASDVGGESDPTDDSEVTTSQPTKPRAELATEAKATKSSKTAVGTDSETLNGASGEIDAETDSPTAGKPKNSTLTANGAPTPSTAKGASTNSKSDKDAGASSTNTVYEQAEASSFTLPIILGCTGGVFGGLVLAGFVYVAKLKKSFAKPSPEIDSSNGTGVSSVETSPYKQMED